MQTRSHLFFKPDIQHVVQIDVGQKRRDDPALRWNGDGSDMQTLSGPNGTTIAHVAALEPDPADPTKTALFVGGTPGDNTIVISPADAHGGLQVVLNGVPQGIFKPTGHLIVYGQGNKDTIDLADRIIGGATVMVAAPAILYAGSGDAVLDARGSSVTDVLIGGPGNDVLWGA